MRKFEVVPEYEGIAVIPTRSTEYSAGYDLVAAKDVTLPSSTFNILRSMSRMAPAVITLEDCKKEIELEEVEPTLIPTGITFHGEPGDVLSIRPRSGLSTKTFLLIPNSPGTVDIDYFPNEIKVPMINLWGDAVIIPKGTRIAQAIIEHYEITDDEKTPEAKRDGGFGSTGQ